MNNKIKVVLVLVCVAMAFTGVGIFISLQSQSKLEAHTQINVEGETTSKTLKATLTGFYPGCTQEYQIGLTGDLADSYNVTLTFRNDKKQGGLENFITVVISTSNFTLEKPLKDLLNGDVIDLGTNASQITISYTMPTDTDDEAQGTTCDFYVDLTAKNS